MKLGREIAPGPVALHLLDASQGNPVQSWNFTGRPAIVIGRADSNDVTVSDPRVSRVHARLEFQRGAWMLVSMGRHGTVMDDHVIAERALADRDIFQLGRGGPSLRFELGVSTNTASATMENIDPNVFALFGVDEQRKAQEVDEIANATLFQDLMEQSQRMKARRSRSNLTPPDA